MWLQFILTGAIACALAAIVAVGPRWSISSTTRRIVTAAISMVALLGLTVTFLTRPVTTLGDETPWYQQSPWLEVILFTIMLAGMSARFITLAIEDRRERMKANPGKKIGIRLDVWELVYPMMVSVITFGALLQQVGSSEFSTANVIMSFQTGFFWQTLLARVDTKAT